MVDKATGVMAGVQGQGWLGRGEKAVGGRAAAAS